MIVPALGPGPGGEPAIGVLARWPGLERAIAVSLASGLGSTMLALLMVALLCAGWHGTRLFGWIERLLAPLLSVPHAAAALGLAMLVAPSGMAFRLAAPVLGLDVPPDLLIVQDRAGLALTAGLAVKEAPFLLLMTLAALPQAAPERRMAVARSLGRGRAAGWLLAVFPSIYVQIRLPVLVVLSYGMTVVDVAQILGPSTPSTLSVQVTRWMAHPDLDYRALAAAGALVQTVAVLGALLLWLGGERAVACIGRAWLWRGSAAPEGVIRAAGLALPAAALALVAGLGLLGLWSVAARWSFPNVLPDELTLRSWARFGPDMIRTAASTMTLAGCATAIALALAVGRLEAEHRFGRTAAVPASALVYLPLIVPQIAFLPGLALLSAGAGRGWEMVSVLLGHVVFVLPYVLLSLSGPFRAWDVRFARVAAGMGTSPGRVLWRLRLPMLLAPVLTAAAVGVAVSVGQYLPTLLLGGGRIATLATEAVALSAGGDRRAIGVWGLGQAAAALLPFALAVLVPAIAFRHRRGLRHG